MRTVLLKRTQSNWQHLHKIVGSFFYRRYATFRSIHVIFIGQFWVGIYVREGERVFASCNSHVMQFYVQLIGNCVGEVRPGGIPRLMQLNNGIAERNNQQE